MAVEKLKNFLLNCTRGKKEPHNYVSLRGGRYFNSAEKFSSFIDLYICAVPQFSSSSYTSLAWRPPNSTYKPLCLDFDIKLSENVKIPDQDFVDLVQWIADIVVGKTNQDAVPVVLSRRPGNYKQTSPDGSTYYKTGFHAFFFKLLVTQEVALSIRERCLPFLDEFRKKYPILNSSEDIFDKKVVPLGKTGLLMVSFLKK